MAVHSTPLIGRLIRMPLRLIPRTARMPMLLRPLWGNRWLVRSGTHDFWVGTHDQPLVTAVRRMVAPGSVFYDIGGHAGFYTLLASALVGREGQVFAFEPSPPMLTLLREHLRLNRITNATVLDIALGEVAGEVAFRQHENLGLSRPDPSGQVKVTMARLDDLVGTGKLPPPDFVKIDVSGYEMGVLKGATGMLTRHKPVLFMQLHSYDRTPAWFTFLPQLGYELRPLDGARLDMANFFYAVHTARDDRRQIRTGQGRNSGFPSDSGRIA